MVLVSVRYDEAVILSRLSAVDRSAKTAFAASCAQRLLRLFDRYALSAGTPELAPRLVSIVVAAWDVASGAEADVAALQAEAEGMVPTDEDGWTLETGYAQNAAAAAAYAIRTWLSDDPREAAWAARQVYDLADYAVLQGRPALDLNAPESEAQVLESETVQNALRAIDRALAVVESAPSTWQELRADATADSEAWASTLP